MKNFCFSIILPLVLLSCKSGGKEETKTFVSFGNKISVNNAISQKEMATKFENLKVGDTISVKFASKVNSVCQKKGCWIKVPLQNNKESRLCFFYAI